MLSGLSSPIHGTCARNVLVQVNPCIHTVHLSRVTETKVTVAIHNRDTIKDIQTKGMDNPKIMEYLLNMAYETVGTASPYLQGGFAFQPSGPQGGYDHSHIQGYGHQPHQQPNQPGYGHGPSHGPSHGSFGFVCYLVSSDSLRGWRGIFISAWCKHVPAPRSEAVGHQLASSQREPGGISRQDLGMSSSSLTRKESFC